MAMVIGNIKAVLGLDSTGFTKGMLNAQNAAAIFGNTLTAMVTNPVLGAIGAAQNLANGLIASSAAVLDNAEKWDLLSKRMGLSVEIIQTFEQLMAKAGGSSEEADSALLAFVRKLGDARKDGGATIETLRQLGISIEDLGDTEGSLRSVLDQFNSLSDAQLKSAAAAELFNKSGGDKLIAALGGGSKALDEYMARLRSHNLLLSGDTVAQMADLEGKIESMREAWEGTKQSLTVEFLQGFNQSLGQEGTAGIEAFARALSQDLAPAAREAGAAMGPIVKAFAEVADGLSALVELARISAASQSTKHPERAGWNWLEHKLPFIKSIGDLIAEGVTPGVPAGHQYYKEQAARRRARARQ